MNIRSIRRESGAIFANLALSTAAVGSVAAVTADWAAQQSAMALQQQQGYIFATINDAVGNYMTLLFAKLTEQDASGADSIPASCANLPYRYQKSVALDPDILANHCKLKLPLTGGGEYIIKNAFQPTLADLKDMGMLDHGISESPVLATDLVIAGPDASGAVSTNKAPNGYAISITPKCVGSGPAATSCTNVNKALSSSVLNIQPFVQSKYIQNFLPLLWSAGADAAMSGPPDAANVQVQTERTNPTGEFRSIQAGWTRENPITQTWTYSTTSTSTSYARGVDNLVVMRNGYDSAYWQLIRRDGASVPTADWNFNDKSLTHVGNFQAASGEITGDFKVGGNQTVAGNQTVNGKQSVTGNLDVGGTGTFKGLLTAMADLVVKGATELQGTLKVVGNALFKGDVTLEKTLLVKGNTQIEGALTGTSATFSGALTANSLMIGSTQISKDGTLLGGPTGWGVTAGSACSQNYALAQSTDGKVQICRSGAWTPLITNENVVGTAPGAGQDCSPEGAPGRLPDGTLAVCKDGKWEPTLQGSESEGGTCSVDGSLATTTAPPNVGLILLGCKDGKWTTKVFTLPKLTYGNDGGACKMNDELALDTRGYPSLLICRDGKWQAPGTQLLSGMRLGSSCTLDGVLAADIEKTGLVVCKGGVWSKITEPVNLGGPCADEGRMIRNADGSQWFCVMAQDGNVWATMPGNLDLFREDKTPVNLTRLVQFNGGSYYFYSEPGYGLNKSQTYAAIAYWLSGSTQEEVTTYQNRRSAFNNHNAWSSRMPPYNYATGYLESRNDCQTYQVELPSAWELHQITRAFNGRPRPWNFNFQDGAEVWTATRRDECSNWGCDEPWSGGGGSWSDHVTVDLWNMHIFHRWNTDQWAVVLKVKKLFGGDFTSFACSYPS